MSCLVSLFLGNRSAGLLLILSSPDYYHTVGTEPIHNPIPILEPALEPECRNGIAIANAVPHRPSSAVLRFELATSRSKVDVGRHKIPIRPWPHPDPFLVHKSCRIMQRVQQEQRMLNSGRPPDWRKLIVITPTYRRTFQAPHLNGLAHTLMLLPPGKALWIVVEAGGVSDDTSALLAQWRHHISVCHIPSTRGMPAPTSAWEERRIVETQMRVKDLRWIIKPPLEVAVLSKNTPWSDPLPEQYPHQSVYLASAMSAYMHKHTRNYGKASKPKRYFCKINRRNQNTRKSEEQQVSQVSGRNVTN